LKRKPSCSFSADDDAIIAGAGAGASASGGSSKKQHGAGGQEFRYGAAAAAEHEAAPDDPTSCYIRNPHPHDVLLLLSSSSPSPSTSTTHPGNAAFTRLVEYNIVTFQAFLSSNSINKKNETTTIHANILQLLVARSIVEAIQQQTPPGRFLVMYEDKIDTSLSMSGSGGGGGGLCWYDKGTDYAIKETLHVLRRGADDVRTTLQVLRQQGTAATTIESQEGAHEGM
jgi:hypothetical protein